MSYKTLIITRNPLLTNKLRVNDLTYKIHGLYNLDWYKVEVGKKYNQTNKKYTSLYYTIRNLV